MSASGLFVSPMLIFLCLQMTPSLSHGGHPGGMCVLKIRMDEQRPVCDLTKTFRLKFSVLHSECHTSKHGEPLQSCISSCKYWKTNGIIVVATVVESTMEVDPAGPSNGGISTSHVNDGSGSLRGVKRTGGSAILGESLPLPSTCGMKIQKVKPKWQSEIWMLTLEKFVLEEDNKIQRNNMNKCGGNGEKER